MADSDFDSPEVTADIAAQVLWHFNAGEFRRRPGSFAGRLIGAIAAADPQNRARLRRVFPGYVLAVEIITQDKDGVRLLEVTANPANDVTLSQSTKDRS